jgi:hypothetical protein
MSVVLDNSEDAASEPISTPGAKRVAERAYFVEYLMHSTVSYFNRGSYGIGFKLKLNDVAKSKYRVLSLNNTADTVVCDCLFMKLVPLDGSPSDKPLLDELKLYTTQTSEFLDEIKVQVDVYKKTNTHLEAVCPPILYVNMFSNAGDKSTVSVFLTDVIKQMDERSRPTIEYIKNIYDRSRNNGDSRLKLGVIVMAFAENYDTLYNVLNKTERIYTKMHYQMLAAYELVRLYNIGYFHGDSHLHNILINIDYIYKADDMDDFSNRGRCLIIDYGMTFKGKNMNKDYSFQEKLSHIAQKETPRSNQSAYTWAAYRWILPIVNFPNLNAILGELNTRITDYQTTMMEFITERYPSIVENVRKINATAKRNSALTGGKTLVGSQIEYATLPPMQQTKDITKEGAVGKNAARTYNITGEQFEQIFNPGHLNISQIGNEYENTVQNGELSLEQITSSPLGGRRKRKYTRKCKRTKKCKATRNRRRTRR